MTASKNVTYKGYKIEYKKFPGQLDFGWYEYQSKLSHKKIDEDSLSGAKSSITREIEMLKRINTLPKVKKPVVKKPVVKKPVAKKQTGTTNKAYDLRKQALPPGIRISKATGKPYKEVRANRSDTGKLLGIPVVNLDIFNKDVLKDFEYTLKQISIYEHILIMAKFGVQNEKNKQNKLKLQKQCILIDLYVKEMKQHYKELKQFI